MNAEPEKEHQSLVFVLLDIAMVQWPIDTINQYGNDTCIRCKFPLSRPCPQDFRLVPRLMLEYDEELEWSRELVCDKCVIARDPGSRPNDDYLYRQDRSAQIFLLLLELGLPGDIAWPIAAAACLLL